MAIKQTLPAEQMSFDELMAEAVRHTIIDFIRKGDWLKMDYNAKLQLDAAWLRQMHSRVSMDRVMEIVKDRVEQRIADGIMNGMAQEVANDCKHIMCNKELREDIRAVIRAKIREVESATTSEA